MKAFLSALVTLALLPAAALAVETEGEGENVRHVKNLPHTEAPNANTVSNQGTDLEFATITVGGDTTTPATGTPATPATPATPVAKKAKKCRKPRKGARGKARKRAMKRFRRCRAKQRRIARKSDADPAAPGVQRTFAFAGSYYDGVDIIAVTDPETPPLASHYDCGVAQGDVQIFQRDGRTYMAYADDTYDVFASQCTRDVPRDLGADWADGDPPGDGGGMYVVDVTDPYAPRTVSFVPVELGSHNLTVHPSGRYVYNSNAELITSFEPSVEIIDISDLAAPKVVGDFALETYPGLGTESHDISFSPDGSRAYVAALSHAEILDTTDPVNPAHVSTVLDPAINVWHQSEQIDVGDRSYLIVEDEFAGAEGTSQCPNGAVHVYDITDETTPTKVGAFQIDEIRPTQNTDLASQYRGRCTAHVFQVHREEQLMIIGWYNAGVRVLDLSELEGYRIGDQGTGGISQLGYFQFPDTDVWAAKAPQVSRDGFHFFANDKKRGFDVYEYEPGAESAGGRWLSPAQALEGARELRALRGGLDLGAASGICFLKTG